MQVSWIDPDEIARLAAQLDGPLQREEPAPWDLETLPDMSKLFAMDDAAEASSAQLADAMAAPAPEPMEKQGAAPAPEVEHIREKLRAIRSLALDAGLLPPAKEKSAVGSGSSMQEISAAFDPAKISDSAPAEPAVVRSPVYIPPAPSEWSAQSSGQKPALSSMAASALEEGVHASAVLHPPLSPPPVLPADASITTRLQIFMPWAEAVAPCEDILLVDDHGDLLWGGSARTDLALSVVLAAGAGLRSGSEALTRSSVFIRSRLGEQKELSVLPCPTRFGMVTLALLNAASLSNDVAALLRDTLARCIDESAIAP